MGGYRRYSQLRVCVCLLVTALALRAAMAGSALLRQAADAAAGSGSVIQAMLSAELGAAPAAVFQAAGAAAQGTETQAAQAVETAQAASGDAETAQQDLSEPEPAESAAAEDAEDAGAAEDAASPDEPAVLTFSAEDAAGIAIDNSTGYEVDAASLLAAPLTLDFSGDGPKILIVHTHTAEAYTPSPGWEYEESDTLRTLDETCNVLRVGDEIAEILEDAGIEVLHDRTFHDYPAYDGAYARALTTIETYLEEYPSIQMVIDVHRDASENPDGTLAGPTVTVDGQESAQVMLVVGTDAGGLTHPGWQENLSCALKLQVLMSQAAPGICRDLDLRSERFNQHATAGSLLVEIGSAGNTMDEALLAAQTFAKAVAALATGDSDHIP